MGPTFLLIGVVLLGIAYFIHRKNQQWMALARTATGQVLNLIEKESTNNDDDTTISYYPLVQFLVDGQTYQFQNRMEVNPKKYPVGSSQTIWYNPKNPQDAKIDAKMGNLVWPIVCGVLGVALVGFGIFGWDV